MTLRRRTPKTLRCHAETCNTPIRLGSLVRALAVDGKTVAGYLDLALGLPGDRCWAIEIKHGPGPRSKFQTVPDGANAPSGSVAGSVRDRLGSQSARTQVSLLPPPCDELTTSDPLVRATRVSPPGTTSMPSP